jgi:hypothetical protein
MWAYSLFRFPCFLLSMILQNRIHWLHTKFCGYWWVVVLVHQRPKPSKLHFVQNKDFFSWSFSVAILLLMITRLLVLLWTKGFSDWVGVCFDTKAFMCESGPWDGGIASQERMHFVMEKLLLIVSYKPHLVLSYLWKMLYKSSARIKLLV